MQKAGKTSQASQESVRNAWRCLWQDEEMNIVWLR